MTQQNVMLHQLWQNQPPQGNRFRAMIKADPYSWDEGRSLWLLINPTLVQSRTVLASHMWVKQDHSMTFSPPIGATITFNADVSPYMRKNGMSGFGLINLRNVLVEAEAGAYVAGADYEIIRDDITVDEFALQATALLAQIDDGELLVELDLVDVASGRLEQSIVAGVKSRTGKLAQRMQFNERIANLALLQEEVTGKFLQLWQQSQAAATELARLEVEIGDDPESEAERLDLQQLATRQREMAAAYWHWQPPQLAEEMSSEAANAASGDAPADTVTDQAETTISPPVVVIANEQTEAEADVARAALRRMIAETLEAEHPNAMPAVLAPTVRTKTAKRQPKLPATLPSATLIELPAAISPLDEPTNAAIAEPEQIIDSLTTLAVEESSAQSLLDEQELPTGRLDGASLEEPPDPEQPKGSPTPVTERARDMRGWHEQIVAEVWHLVQRKQPHDGRVAPYSLAQIKDGRRRETDHLKLIGLKAIVELLALVGERPTSKELARYLGYDLPKGWSPSKLPLRKLPQEDEQVREGVVSEVRTTMRIGA